MDVTGPVDPSRPTARIKRKFLQWATKWCHADVDQDAETPDVATIVCLLQALGARLCEFERSDEGGDKRKSSVSIVAECQASGMRAVMELDDVRCQCSEQMDTKDASFWSVSGMAPSGSVDSINKYEETGSSLLPYVSKESRAMMRDVLHHLCAEINSSADVNQNRNSTMNLSASGTHESTKSSTDLADSFARTRCLTQPEIYRARGPGGGVKTPVQSLLLDKRLSASVQNIRRTPQLTRTAPTPESRARARSLQRQRTWDFDNKSDGEPRPSPPKMSSSPVALNDLCTSLGQVSLQSEDDPISLSQCLKKIKYYTDKVNYYADKAQNCYGALSPGPRDEKLFVRPAAPPTKKSPTSPTSRPTEAATAKPLVRRTIGGPLLSRQVAMKPTSTVLRRRSIGSASQALKLAVAGVQRTGCVKKVAPKPPTSSSTSSLSSGDSRVVLSAKRRVSPDVARSPAATRPTGQPTKPTGRTPLGRSPATSTLALPSASGVSRTPQGKAAAGTPAVPAARKSVSPTATKKTSGTPRFGVKKP